LSNEIDFDEPHNLGPYKLSSEALSGAMTIMMMSLGALKESLNKDMFCNGIFASLTDEDVLNLPPEAARHWFTIDSMFMFSTLYAEACDPIIPLSQLRATYTSRKAFKNWYALRNRTLDVLTERHGAPKARGMLRGLLSEDD
jgi:hypothetical protein